MIITSALTFASFFKLISYTFFGELNKQLIATKEVPILMQLPMIVLAILCVLLGINAQFMLDSFITFAISGLVHSRSVPKVEFWTQGAALNSLFIMTLGFIVYIIASKLGLIGRKRENLR